MLLLCVGRLGVRRERRRRLQAGCGSIGTHIRPFLCRHDSARCTERLSQEVEAYDEQKPWSALEGEGAILCDGFDSKGVSLVLEERGGNADSKAVRLGKGERKEVEKEATLSVSFSIDRKVRTPQEIVASLFKPLALKWQLPCSAAPGRKTGPATLSTREGRFCPTPKTCCHIHYFRSAGVPLKETRSSYSL